MSEDTRMPPFIEGIALLRYVVALAAGIALLGGSSILLFAFLPAPGISEATGFALILVGPVVAGIIIGVLAKSAGAAAGIGFVAGLTGVAIGTTTLPVYLYVSVSLELIMGVAAGFTGALGSFVMKEMRSTREG